jgi:hypothetical protein
MEVKDFSAHIIAHELAHFVGKSRRIASEVARISQAS